MAQNTHSLGLVAASSQVAEIADASQTGLDFSGDMTLEACVYYTDAIGAGANRPIISKWYAGNAYLWRIVNTAGQYSFSFYMNDGASEHYPKNIATPNTATWYHYATSWKASTSTAEFYINGVSQGTTVGAKTSIINRASPFIVGGITGDVFWNGLIDEARAWNVVRTTAQINAWKQKDAVGQAGLQGYWKLNNSYADSSGNGNTLTPTNSPTFSTTVPFDNYLPSGGMPLSML